MALRGTLTHRKTRRLAMKLGVDLCFALGMMEALWSVAAEQAATGDIGRLTDDDIAMEIFYSGDSARLIEAMVYARYLDRHPVHRLIVHDWHQHSDDTTDNKLARAGLRYANGAIPRMKKLAQAERDRLHKLYYHDASNAAQAANPNLPGTTDSDDELIDEGGDSNDAAGGGPAQDANVAGDDLIGKSGEPAECMTDSGDELIDEGGDSSDAAGGGPAACARRSTKSHKKALPEPVPEPKANTSPQPPAAQGAVDRDAPNRDAHGSTGNKAFHAETNMAATAGGFDLAVMMESKAAMRECGVSNQRMQRVFEDAMRMQHERERMSPAESRMMMVASWNAWKTFCDRGLARHTIGPRKFIGEGYWLDEKLWPVDAARIEREMRESRSSANAMIGVYRG